MSYKNQLQELLARAGDDVAQYCTSRVGGPPHAPLFVSHVTVGTATYGGATCGTKKEAEQSAAHEALADQCRRGAMPYEAPASHEALVPYEAFTSHEAPAAYETPASYEAPAALRCAVPVRCAVFVDLENVQKLPGLELLEGLADVYVFVARTHALADRPFPAFVRVERVDSTQKDACDVAILLCVAELAVAWNATPEQALSLFVFVSRDHLFGTSAELLRQRPGLDAFQATSVAECLQKIEDVRKSGA